MRWSSSCVLRGNSTSSPNSMNLSCETFLLAPHTRAGRREWGNLIDVQCCFTLFADLKRRRRGPAKDCGRCLSGTTSSVGREYALMSEAGAAKRGSELGLRANSDTKLMMADLAPEDCNRIAAQLNPRRPEGLRRNAMRHRLQCCTSKLASGRLRGTDNRRR